MLLEHCPNLEDLHIPATDGIARLFLHAWCPHLKRLSFGYGDVPLTKWNDLSIQTFLDKHQTLERLCLPNQSQATWTVNRLPNLKALDTGIHRDPSSVLVDPAAGEKHKFLSCVNFTKTAKCSCPGGSLAFLKRVPNLRVLRIFCSKPSNGLLVSIAEAVLRLERLHFELWTFLTTVTATSVENGVSVHNLPCAVRMLIPYKFP